MQSGLRPHRFVEEFPHHCFSFIEFYQVLSSVLEFSLEYFDMVFLALSSFGGCSHVLFLKSSKIFLIFLECSWMFAGVLELT